ncbi:PrgI family protein [Patescibacteria group bacterium]
MQAKVPQNVQMADKIVGPLTLRHMIIIGAGGGFAYLIYTILSRSYYWEVWILPVGIIVGLTLLIAFVKIYNVGFGKFVILFLEYIFLPRKRHWLKSSAEIIGMKPIQVEKKGIKKKTKDKGAQTEKTIREIDDITKILDTYGRDNN